jgi:UDP-glucose 4-epimerase
VAGRVYNIGGGSRVSVNQVLAMLGRVTGLSIRRTPSQKQKGDMRDTCADTALARADLGFAPRVTLADGLAEQFRWLQAVPESA